MDLIDWLLTGLDIRWWDVLLTAIGAVFVAAVALTAPLFSRSAGRRFANQHRAYVDVAYVKQFDRATIRERRRGQLLLGVPICLAMLTFADDGAVLLALSPGLMALALCADNVLRLRRFGHEFHNPAAPTGIARARAVGIRDFAGPGIRLYWTAVALAVGIIVVDLSGAVTRQGLTSLLLAQVLSAAALCLLIVTLPLVWKMMVSRPERAEDAAHLYLQDAWRASLLREATATAHLPVLFFVLAVSIGRDVDTEGFPLDLVAMLILGVAMLCTLLPDTNLHFRKRLWPMLTPGQVLMPGDPIPSGSPA